MPPDHAKLDIIRRIEASHARTGRRYLIDLNALDMDSLRELERLLRDLEYDRRRAVEQARVFPWR